MKLIGHTFSLHVAFTILIFSCSLSNAEIVDQGTIDQGANWTTDKKQKFYVLDQGSRLIPWAWMQALEWNNRPFMDDSLSRYGYLKNNRSIPQGLPVGFVVSQDGSNTLGLTCAACHTRKIEVNETPGIKKEYIIDGGPALADLGAFWGDLVTAVRDVVNSDSGNFAIFSEKVLGHEPTPKDKQNLKDELELWLAREGAIAKALPKKNKDNLWGAGRLDAVGMILNRVAGLDIGHPPTYVITDNIVKADAPVRPPFLWNASIQNLTQWPGFANNGTPLFGLIRNLGEVYGVFGVVHPTLITKPKNSVNYNNDTSAQFAGLAALEELITQIGPPQWPKNWPYNNQLAEEGCKIFATPSAPSADDSCANCHGISVDNSIPNHTRWKTPLADVGTDIREYAALVRKVDTGSLTGTPNFRDNGKPFTGPSKAIDVLVTAVGGAVTQYIMSFTNDYILQPKSPPSLNASKNTPFIATSSEAMNIINDAYPLEGISLLEGISKAKSNLQSTSPATSPFKYESRVLQGIWAAAPYLHNGSVPTLYDLLQPVAKRPTQFAVGPIYDIENVGLARSQSTDSFMFKTTTDCSSRNSGDSSCGHEYGTNLSDHEKRALIEYLKNPTESCKSD